MDLANSWTIATKDISLYKKNKTTFIFSILFPILLSVGLSGILLLQRRMQSITPDFFIMMLNASSFSFYSLACLLPAALAAHSIVGEKIEKSLEPLLAAPITDSELLFGKSLATFLPSIAATYIGAAIFMPLADLLTHDILGYYYYPNEKMTVILLLIIPITCMLSTQLSVVISSRVNDLRTAYHLASVILVPFVTILILFNANIIPFTTTNLLLISAVIAIADVVLFFVSTITFHREEILTRLK
jgi:ABC-2 type transport system permease protein